MFPFRKHDDFSKVTKIKKTNKIDVMASSEDSDQLKVSSQSDHCPQCVLHDWCQRQRLSSLTLCLLVSSADNLGKQFGPRSGQLFDILSDGTHQPLYNTVCYITILDITRFNNGQIPEMYRLYRKMTIHEYFSI